MAYKVKGTCVDASFLVLGPYQTNVYVVSDGSATFVVDPASDAKKIAAALGGRKLDAVVLTHRHSDHVAAAAELRSLTGATVIASAIDADMICGDKPVPRDDQKFPACPVDQRVNHGDVVKIGNMPWKVIGTPGHTEGSMCLFLDSSLTERLDAKPVLIAGDTLFFGSIGRTDFSGGSMSAMRKSLKRLAVLPDDTVVLPGHGNLTTIGGERRRVALCRLLLEAPDLLLLDEPTNHLDAESVLWLEQFLHKYPGAVLAVTHDRYFLDNVAEWICEVDRGSLYPYKGNYSTYLETKAARMASQKQRDEKLAKRLASELEWVRSSPKARQAKSRARLERYDQMAAEAAQSKKLDFTEIQIPAGPRLGAEVLKVEHLHKQFGDRVLMDDLSFELPRNGIVGVIGPNGVGKSTLFKMIMGIEQPTSGSLTLGETVKVSYVDQGREGIEANKSVWEVVSGGLDYMMVCETEVPSRAYVASFGFKGSDQQKPAGVLSGGERNRLNLALTLKQGGNLLLLDEPTNDLDVETLSSLEEALLRFPGCAVVTSHDRMFLDRVVTHILAWEGTDDNPGNWFWFEGNFESYQKNRIERLGEEAAKPHRLHRKLTRD